MPRVEASARRLAEAWRAGTRIPDLGDARPRTRGEAYAVQDAVTALLGLAGGRLEGGCRDARHHGRARPG